MALEPSSRSSEDTTPAVIVKLVVVDPDPSLQYPERCITLHPGSAITIGRTSKRSAEFAATMTNARFDSPVISRSHARLTVDGKYRVYLEDTKSLHGTTINDHQLPSNRPHRVCSGDHIQFGKPIIHGQDTFQPLSAYLGSYISNPECDNPSQVFRVPDDPPSSIDYEDYESDQDLSNAATRMMQRGIRWSAREHRRTIRQAAAHDTIDLTGNEFDTRPAPTAKDDELVFLSERPVMRISNVCSDPSESTLIFPAPTKLPSGAMSPDRSPDDQYCPYASMYANNLRSYIGKVGNIETDRMTAPGADGKEVGVENKESESVVHKTTAEGEDTPHGIDMPMTSGAMGDDQMVEESEVVPTRQHGDSFFFTHPFGPPLRRGNSPMPAEPSDAADDLDTDESQRHDVSAVDSDNDESQLSNASAADSDEYPRSSRRASAMSNSWNHHVQYEYDDYDESDDELESDTDIPMVPLEDDEPLENDEGGEFIVPSENDEDGEFVAPPENDEGGEFIVRECVPEEVGGDALQQALPQPDELSVPVRKKRKADDISSATLKEEIIVDANKGDHVSKALPLPASADSEPVLFVPAESSSPEDNMPKASPQATQTPDDEMADAPLSCESLARTEPVTDAAPLPCEPLAGTELVTMTAEPPRKRLRRMVEALGCVAIGGAALFSTLVATAPNL